MVALAASDYNSVQMAQKLLQNKAGVCRKLKQKVEPQ